MMQSRKPRGSKVQGARKMAYATKGLTAMQVYSNDCEIITLRERTRVQMYKYMCKYMTNDEIMKYEYIDGSQFVSEYNGYTYAEFRNIDGFNTTLAIYDNPELG